MSSVAQLRPVQLQVNTAGAWKTVVRFDAGNDLVATQIQESAQVLHEADPSTYWRIATNERSPDVLRHMGKNTHGLWIDRKEA
ncbi:hypothetical protein [Comamonas aquatica]|uniref:hypothetical protein n=1 Tax=Comamonas aquatica TaxID=225991 RepID=UPI00244B24B3|nr:hypothetical protein [Comamonas aquatica]MDH0494281.1 hypothetical protein [Comamonas aquatica]